MATVLLAGAAVPAWAEDRLGPGDDEWSFQTKSEARSFRGKSFTRRRRLAGDSSSTGSRSGGGWVMGKIEPARRRVPDRTCGGVCGMCSREAGLAFLHRGRYVPVCTWCRHKAKRPTVGIWWCKSQGVARVHAGRNDRATVCDLCGKTYAEHPPDADYGFAAVLCDGSLTTFM